MVKVLVRVDDLNTEVFEDAVFSRDDGFMVVRAKKAEKDKSIGRILGVFKVYQYARFVDSK